MPSSSATEVWTDGACIGNPGAGGWGAVILSAGTRRELSSGFLRTTNNRMELMGPIRALQALEPRSTVVLRTDSLYVVKGIEKGWAKGWRAKVWRRQGKTVPNWDLWNRLLELCEFHRVRFEWVRGHAGHAENERCDELAVAAAGGSDLPTDLGYEQPPTPPAAATPSIFN